MIAEVGDEFLLAGLSKGQAVDGELALEALELSDLSAEGEYGDQALDLGDVVGVWLVKPVGAEAR